jgi:hypothetical protein
MNAADLHKAHNLLFNREDAIEALRREQDEKIKHQTEEVESLMTDCTVDGFF